MALESGSFLNDLVATNPAAGDVVSQGDDHLRLLKTVLTGTFPSLAGRVWRSQSKAGAYTVLATDNMSVIACSATLTLTLTAAATLGNGHMFVVTAAAGATVTIDPNATELINGNATLAVPPSFVALVFCNGTAFTAALMPQTDAAQWGVVNAGSLSVSNVAALKVANIGSLSVSAVLTAPVANIGSLSVSAVLTAPVANIGSLSVSAVAVVSGGVASILFRNFNVTSTALTLTASNGAHMIITATVGAITVHLPITPQVGSHVQIHNATTREDHVIGRNGQPIMSLAEDMTIDKPNVTVALVYVDATRGWRMV